MSRKAKNRGKISRAGRCLRSPCCALTREPARGKRMAPSHVRHRQGRAGRRSKNYSLHNTGTQLESLPEGRQFRHPPEDCETNEDRSIAGQGLSKLFQGYTKICGDGGTKSGGGDFDQNCQTSHDH